MPISISVTLGHTATCKWFKLQSGVSRTGSFCVFSLPFPILILLSTKLEGRKYHFKVFGMIRPRFEPTISRLQSGCSNH